jgi:adenosylhomocysteine nucleosidase
MKVHLDMKPEFVVIISADIEWQATLKFYSMPAIINSPLGDWFRLPYKDGNELVKPIIILHGGWGKVAAASSCQYIIDHWKPQLLINLGTCGGFEGEIEIGETILVEKTIIYDIYEQMGDAEEHIKHYSTEIDTSWLVEPCPIDIKRKLLLSGDRDLFCKDISALKTKYGAIAADWESGAIAWVANKNRTPCLILRGVSDLVSEMSGQAYNGNIDLFYRNTDMIMNKLLKSLPEWLHKYSSYLQNSTKR